MALLVIPGVGLFFDSWLGFALGLVLYLASRHFAPGEEREMAERLPGEYPAYRKGFSCRGCEGRALASDGLLYVSYNALAGWNVRGLVRDHLLAHTRASGDARQGCRGQGCDRPHRQDAACIRLTTVPVRSRVCAADGNFQLGKV